MAHASNELHTISATSAPEGAEHVPRPLEQRKALGDAVVELFNISKSYRLDGGEEVHALRDVSLHGSTEFEPIRRGEFVMIRGPSGGGKTSLLNIIGTIDSPSKGSVRLFGEHVDFATATDAFLCDLRLRRIGFVFQTFNLLGQLSAYENVELPMSILAKLNGTQRGERTKALLRVVGLEDRAAHTPAELSGGEQQRVTIARALSNRPDVLLLDEPTGDLDTANTVLIMDLLLRINQQTGMTCCMVTHNPDLECYADRILYIGDGHIQSEAINVEQTPLRLDTYARYLHKEADE